MRKFKLKNGITVLAGQRDSNVVAIEFCVHTGSNNESKDIAGISHFLEHMLFEGTTTRTAKQISESIENVGGEFNAATGNERTFYYVLVPKNKSELGLDILSDIIQNPLFDNKIFEKERKVVLEEIKMVNDQPSIYQWILFEKNIFRKHPTKNPVYGRVDSVKSITPAKMRNYFEKWYVPTNITLSLVGDVRSLIPKLEKYMGSNKRKSCPNTKRVIEPKDLKPKVVTEHRKINQSYVIMGYKTIDRKHKDSVVLDVIEAIFSKGLSGRINEEIRQKRGLAYSVGAEHESKKGYGFFAFYLNTEKKNVELCKKLILNEIDKLSNLTSAELNNAKDYMIGNTLVRNEDVRRQADNLAFWESIGDAKQAKEYLKLIKKVTVQDVIRVRNKYFKNNYTMVKLESK